MKTRFNTYDLKCAVWELQRYVGMRVNNVYDIDSKTYLIRLHRGEEKVMLLLESGIRLHSTVYEWPKNVAPSGFSMKMRKHLRNKRLERLIQLGTDRVVDMQFGSGEAAYHLLLELYDRGNLVLTDHSMTILYVLRPHTEGDRFKFAAREPYPIDERIREQTEDLSLEALTEAIARAKRGDQLKKILLPHYDYGPPLIEHVLLGCGFKNSTKLGKGFEIEDVVKLHEAMKEARAIFNEPTGKGYIIQKPTERPHRDDVTRMETFYANDEFHPYIYRQHVDLPRVEYDAFIPAVDEYYSTLEHQRIETRAAQQQREATRKLENVRSDHDRRLRTLASVQETDRQRAELITRNRELVDAAIVAIQNALAAQMSWSDIELLVEEARATNDPIAGIVKRLKLPTNHMTLHLTDPYCVDDEDASEEEDRVPAMEVDVDLGLTAYANARRYYDQKRNAAKKQQKTIESQGKALKSAEKKTKQTLKEMQTIKNIQRARKVYWFEKFYWFVSSENFLVIAGRDQQQNELIVKRYMRPHDIYVHADVHGASSVLIKNPKRSATTTSTSSTNDLNRYHPVPPKTLNEAGTMAVCYSVAWEAKVITNAYWVYGDQVSKTAPTGEYLTVGSFMIRGKKNYLPVAQLVLGFSFLFRLEEASVERHADERRAIVGTENEESVTDETKDLLVDDMEIPVMDESDEEQVDELKEDDAVKVEEKDVEETNADDDDGPKFPDTEIKIRHIGDDRADIAVSVGDKLDLPQFEMIQTTNRRSNKPKNNKNNKHIKIVQEDAMPNKHAGDVVDGSKQGMKRGQKSKLKKIREKYKDQDDEERRLRMDILQSAGRGNKKNGSKGKKDVDQKGPNDKKSTIPPPSNNAARHKDTVIVQQQQQNDQQKREVVAIDDDDNEDDVDNGPHIDVDMIDSLTGMPLVEDELLFAVPVIAPYNALANYKFKVKLTPGTNRRGKAAKTALNMFLQDRAATQREKDLLKAVKDEQLARNVPGKVKLSAPKLQQIRK